MLSSDVFFCQTEVNECIFDEKLTREENAEDLTFYFSNNNTVAQKC